MIWKKLNQIYKFKIKYISLKIKYINFSTKNTIDKIFNPIINDFGDVNNTLNFLLIVPSYLLAIKVSPAIVF